MGLAGPRRAAAALGAIAIVLISAVAAIATGDSAPPPRIAFVARSDNPADALAAGPVAGMLGAPLFTTPPSSLAVEARTGLVAYEPELVIVTGGEGAISPAVAAAIADALGLADDQVLRAAGDNRHATAAAIVDLLGDYDMAFLGNRASIDADTLDGVSSSGFLRHGDAIDADTLDGRTAEQIAAEGLGGERTYVFGGRSWVPHSATEFTSVVYDDGVGIFSSTNAGPHEVGIDLSHVVNSTNGWNEGYPIGFSFCYQLDDVDDHISQVEFSQIDPQAGTPTTLLQADLGPTDANSTLLECVDDEFAGAITAGPHRGALNLDLQVTFDTGGGTIFLTQMVMILGEQP